MFDDMHDPTKVRHTLLHSFAEFEDSFRARQPILWACTLAAPVVLPFLAWLLVGLTDGFATANKFVVAALTTFFLLGRFVILAGNEGEVQQAYQAVSLEPGQLFGMVTFLDFVVALFVTFHMGVLFRLPWAGSKLAALVWDGKYLMDKQPWIKRVTFLGLVLFVTFPTSTTGSIGGSIFGRLLGLSRFMTLVGVVLGSIIGNTLMLYFANWFNRYFDQDTIWFKLAGLAILVVAGVLLEWRYQRMKKTYFAKSIDLPPTAPPPEEFESIPIEQPVGEAFPSAIQPNEPEPDSRADSS